MPQIHEYIGRFLSTYQYNKEYPPFNIPLLRKLLILWANRLSFLRQKIQASATAFQMLMGYVVGL